MKVTIKVTMTKDEILDHFEEIIRSYPETVYLDPRVYTKGLKNMSDKELIKHYLAYNGEILSQERDYYLDNSDAATYDNGISITLEKSKK